MRDRFDYDTCWWIIDRLTADNRLARFAEMAAGLPGERIVLLRHDVDYCPEAALALAEREAERGIRATYFLLAGSEYYNLAAPTHAGFARRLAALGHELALHYDVNVLAAHPRARWPALLAAQARLIEDLAEAPVTALSMHQPGLNGEDPFAEGVPGMPWVPARGGVLAAVPYFSDSCRAWWDAAWTLLDNGPIPPALQVCLHPINWAATDRDRETIFKGLHARLAAAMHARGDALMAEIDRHPGVRQHRARKP